MPKKSQKLPDRNSESQQSHEFEWASYFISCLSVQRWAFFWLGCAFARSRPLLEAIDQTVLDAAQARDHLHAASVEAEWDDDELSELLGEIAIHGPRDTEVGFFKIPKTLSATPYVKLARVFTSPLKPFATKYVDVVPSPFIANEFMNLRQRLAEMQGVDSKLDTLVTWEKLRLDQSSPPDEIKKVVMDHFREYFVTRRSKGERDTILSILFHSSTAVEEDLFTRWNPNWTPGRARKQTRGRKRRVKPTPSVQ